MIASLAIVASELLFSSMGAVIKTLATELPTAILVFARNFFGLVALLPILWHLRTQRLRTRVLHFHLFRAIAGVGAMYCFFYAIAHLALAEAVLLKLTAPLFLPIFAMLWLRESLNSVLFAAMLLGFVGVAFVLNPTGTGALSVAAIVGVIGGALAGFAKVAVRRLSMTEPSPRIVFYFAAFASAASALPAMWQWQMPTLAEWLLLSLLGILATLGQLLLTHGYRHAPAARVGPFTYMSVIFAGIYGYLLWGEMPSWLDALGGVLIIAAGLLSLYGGRSESSAPVVATVGSTEHLRHV